VLSAGQIDAFLTTANRTDEQIRAAATLIDAGIGNTQIVITANTVAAIEAINVNAVGRSIPVGLPTELLASMLQVHADLASRKGAFQRVLELAARSPLLQDNVDTADLLDCLGNGSAPAQWFPTDMATVRSLAAAIPAITPVPENSRAGAEVAIQAHSLLQQNICCGQCGGYAPRPVPLPPVTWQKITEENITWDGTHGTTKFTARYTETQGWQINFNAG
jgi:hypothetical protein